jgi:hypothetical protein
MYEEEDTDDLKYKLNEWKEDDSIDSFVRSLSESQIDAVLAEHNKDEEDIELWHTTNSDGLPKEDPKSL